MLRLDLRRLEDGKGKSPYDPRHRAASVLVGESSSRASAQLLVPFSQNLVMPPGALGGWLSSPGLPAGEELYSGVAADLMGRDFTIFRSLGQRPSLRTEPHDSRWLNGEKGAGEAGVPSSRENGRREISPVTQQKQD